MQSVRNRSGENTNYYVKKRWKMLLKMDITMTSDILQ